MPAKYPLVLLIATLCFIQPVWAQSPQTESFFVAPSGNDQNLGTLESPFATLERARLAVRALSNRSGVTINLRAGHYRLKESFTLDIRDSGDNDSPIVYQAYNNEAVFLSGGAALSLNGATPVTDSTILEQLTPAAQKSVFQIDLPRDQIVTLSPFSWERAAPGQEWFDPPAAEELIVAGKRMKLARWPNSGWAFAGAVQADGKSRGDNTGVPYALFNVGDNRAQFWHAGVWILGYWNWDWYDEAIPINPETAGGRNIGLARYLHYGVTEGSRFMALNALSELDEAGEYFIDRDTYRLYLWPSSPLKPDTAVELSMLDTPLIVMDNVSNITLRGLTIENGRHNGIEMRGGSQNSVERCVLRNLGTNAVLILDSSGHSVKDSEIYNTGSRGIAASGGNRLTLTPAGHHIENNEIHDVGQRIAAYRPAVEIRGVGIVVSHNLIHDAPHSAVTFSGNDHSIEFNEIHHVVADTSDAGAIYSGRDWSFRGNRIVNNYLHDLKTSVGRGDVTAIYLDDQLSGTYIEGNVISNTYRGILVGGGRDNAIVNNVVAHCEIPVSLDTRGITQNLDPLIKSLQRMPYQSQLWTKEYPALATILENSPRLPKGNAIHNNIFYRCGKAQIAWLAEEPNTVRDLLDTDINPGFTDPDAGDFSTKDLPLMRKQISTWNPIPFEQIGRHVQHDGPGRPTAPSLHVLSNGH